MGRGAPRQPVLAPAPLVAAVVVPAAAAESGDADRPEKRLGEGLRCRVAAELPQQCFDAGRRHARLGGRSAAAEATWDGAAIGRVSCAAGGATSLERQIQRLQVAWPAQQFLLWLMRFLAVAEGRWGEAAAQRREVRKILRRCYSVRLTFRLDSRLRSRWSQPTLHRHQVAVAPVSLAARKSPRPSCRLGRKRGSRAQARPMNPS
mmetsp:Transcript_51240/g.166107  ORF Transcript_51240/g.166107 Transcript_51240/m.166107 type:complete len:205 (-) Transcript_51240:15-629(-)